MNSSELHEAFRSGIGPERSAKLSDDEVWRYADDAYRTFVRLTGGIADFSSPATVVALTAGEAVSDLDSKILRIMRITRRSDNGDVQVLNQTDLGTGRVGDYGQITRIKLDDKQGVVRYGVIGMELNKIRWVQIPASDDIVDMMIYRLPLTRITKDGQSLDEIDQNHHFALLDWMYYLASRSPDLGALEVAEAYRASFMNYCGLVKREIERYKAKVRIVQYGGL